MGRRERGSDEHRPRRVDGLRRRRQRPDHDRRGPGDRRRRPGRRHDHAAAPARTSSSATAAGSSPPAPTRTASARCRSRSAWSRRPRRASAATTRSRVGTGSAIVMGGTGADTITTGSSTNFVFGDDGYITWVGSELNPEGCQLGRRGQRSDRTSTSSPRPTPRDGGNDHITVGAGKAIVVGGQGDDTITGGSGTNVILGDSGRDLRRSVTTRTRSARCRSRSGSSRPTAPGIGGDDVIHDRHGQRDRDGRHRRRQISTCSAAPADRQHELRLRRRRLHHLGRHGAEPGEPRRWAGADSDPIEHRPRRVDRRPRTAATTRSRSGGPRDRRRRPGQRHDHRRLRHERDPRRQRPRSSPPAPTRTAFGIAADHARPRRDDRSGRRRRRHDHGRHAAARS